MPPPRKYCLRGHLRTPETVEKNGTCKKCSRVACKAFYHANNKEICAKRRKLYSSEPERARALYKNYGMTIDQYNELLVRQNYACAMCQHIGKLVVDHNHHTKQVRGLLCDHCNRIVLPVVEHFSYLIASAKEYLRGPVTSSI